MDENLSNSTGKSSSYGALQRMVNTLFSAEPSTMVRRLQVVLAAEAADLPADLQEIIKLLPPGSYTRAQLCDQLNSALGGHAWGQVYGTVE